MANQIEVLKQTELLGQQFEVYGTPQEPLFKAQDIATMINHSNITKMLALVDDDEKGVNQLLTPGGNQQVWFLTENGLYEVLMQSRKPIAKQFKKGVKAILKEIRTNGGYVATHQEDTPEMIMARALKLAELTIEKHQTDLRLAQAEIRQKDFVIKNAQRVIDSQNEQLIEQTPKVKYTDNVLNSVNTYTSTQMAKELDLRTAEQLHKLLKGYGVMIRQSGQWLLSAKYCGQNYTKTRTHSYTRQDGTQGTNNITVWTERGRWFLHQLMAKKGGK